MHNTVLIIDNGIEQTIEYRDSDFGKFLNAGDYIEIHKVIYKIRSKTYGLIAPPGKWVLKVEPCDIKKEE